ncbi:hypothetical protein WJX73_003662 [Symbiochloris irregularis]|uniref:Uncharacterized protein n=1 Tax=Symbiochloris irregularis TaxID=706552 RepID=A0AAW1NZ29_9CHLO
MKKQRGPDPRRTGGEQQQLLNSPQLQNLLAANVVPRLALRSIAALACSSTAFRNVAYQSTEAWRSGVESCLPPQHPSVEGTSTGSHLFDCRTVPELTNRHKAATSGLAFSHEGAMLAVPVGIFGNRREPAPSKMSVVLLDVLTFDTSSTHGFRTEPQALFFDTSSACEVLHIPERTFGAFLTASKAAVVFSISPKTLKSNAEIWDLERCVLLRKVKLNMFNTMDDPLNGPSLILDDTFFYGVPEGDDDMFDLMGNGKKLCFMRIKDNRKASLQLNGLMQYGWQFSPNECTIAAFVAGFDINKVKIWHF